MSNYKIILFDVDGCLLDFDAQEKEALKNCFKLYNLGTITDEMIKCYAGINKGYWEMLERKEISKSVLLEKRFDDFFNIYNIKMNSNIFNTKYQELLGETIVFNDNSIDLIKKLKKDYTLAVVTNGTKVAQDKKLSKSGINKVIDNIYISDVLGIQKPDVRFFDKVFTDLNEFDKSKYIIVGDSLTSDITGGINAGIDTVWYNKKHLENTYNIYPTYEIDNLNKLKDILHENKKSNN